MREWLLKLLAVGRRGRRDRQLDDELRFHVDELAAAYARRGLPPAEARAAAMREFGGIEHARQAWRDQRTWLPLEEILLDARHGLRVLRRSPSAAVGAAAMLALAVAASVSAFAVVDAVLLAPLPYGDASRLVAVHERYMAAQGSEASVAPGTFVEWTERARALVALTAVDTRHVNLTSDGEPQQLTTAFVSSGFPATVSAAPAIGRMFGAADFEPGHENVVLIDHGFWRTRFGGRPDIVGRTMTADDRIYTIVGVMNDRFMFPTPAADAWMPMPVTEALRANRGSHFLDVFARLREGVSMAAAERDLQAVAADLRREFPDSNGGWDAFLTPMRRSLLGDTRLVLAAIVGAVGFLLIVACANAAGLLLTAGLARQRELAIRSALGARRARVVRQMLTESVVLSMLAAAAGLGIAWAAQPLLESLRPADFLAWKPIAIDGRAAVFAAAAALLAGIVSGTLPAVFASRSPIAAAASQRAPGRGASRVRFALVTVEIALSVLLAISGAGLVRTLARLTAVDLGVEPNGVITVAVSLPEVRYADGARVNAFYDAALDAIARIPSVRAVGATDVMPFSGDTYVRPFQVAGLPDGARPPEIAHYRIVTPGYFEAMGITIRAGRSFTRDDRANRPLSVIVSDTMRRAVWADRNPIGASITFGGSTLMATVVGVADSVRHFGPSAEPPAEMYWPSAQIDAVKSAALNRLRRSMTFVVKTGGDPVAIVPALREAVRGVDSDQPIARVQTLSSMLARTLWLSRASAWIVSIVGLFATLFAIVGVFASASFVVAQQRRGVALRIALGGPAARVSRQAVSTAVGASSAGIVGGAALAWGSAAALASRIDGVASIDALSTLAVGAVMLLATAAACWLPARRAARVSPMEALKVDG